MTIASLVRNAFRPSLRFLRDCAGVAILLLGVGSAAGTLRIMPLGDSLTRGTNDINYPNGDIPGGYRKTLGERLSEESVAFDFIGNASDNAAPGMDPDHNGNNGWRTDEILANLPVLLAQPADRILLLAGTNDLLQAVPVATAAVNLENLIIQITSTLPAARLYVATIPPITQSWNGQSAAVLNANANAYNTEVRNRVATQAAAGRRVSLVDLNAMITLTGATPQDDFYQPGDGIHPGQAGYQHLGNLWFDALLPHIDEAPPSTVGLPAAPSGLSATIASPSRVNLAWADTSPDEAVHQVWSRNTAAGSWQIIATLPANSTSHGVIGLRNGVESRAFAVCAVNASGASAWSNVVTTLVPEDLAFLKTATASASFNASFSPAKANDGLLTTLWASTGSGNHFWQVDLTAPRHLQRVQVITRQDTDVENHRRNFEVRVSNDPTFATYTVLGGQGSTALPYKGTLTLEIPQSAAFRYLRVAKTDGQSFSLTLVKAWGVAAVSPPSTPASFSATALDSSFVRLDWAAVSSNESGFRIERRVGTSAFAPLLTLPAGELTLIDSNLTESTSYTYRIRAFNEAGDSAHTAELGVTTPSATAYELWTQAYPVFAALPAGQRLPSADPDGDGISNLMSHAFGMDPLARRPEHLPSIIRMPGDGAPRWFFRHVRNRFSPALSYQILAAAHPAGPWSAVPTGGSVVASLSGFPQLEHVTVPLFPAPGETRRFFRLWVVEEESSQ